MFRYLFPILLVVLLSGGAAAQDYSNNSSITVTGTGYSSAEPDVARVMFGVNVILTDPAQAVSEAAQLINDSMAAARRMGVAGDEMQTISYSMWTQEEFDDYSYEYTGRMEYSITHTIQVDIEDIENVGEVLAAIVTAGANQINSVTFIVDDTSDMKEDARRNAVQDAIQKAEVIADELGIELGEPTYVSEYDYGYDPYTYYDPNLNYGGGLNYSVTAPSVTPGSYVVSSSVSVTFEILR